MTNKTDKIVTVNEGATYENKQSKELVVAWHIDAGRVVRYSPRDIASGREYRLPVNEFLEQFEEFDDKTPEKPTENNADGTPKE